jgi:hypothetical protein
LRRAQPSRGVPGSFLFHNMPVVVRKHQQSSQEAKDAASELVDRIDKSLNVGLYDSFLIIAHLCMTILLESYVHLNFDTITDGCVLREQCTR